MDFFNDLKVFYKSFKGERGSIGKSHLNKELYYFNVFKSPYPRVIVQYCIHAREFVTTYLAYLQISDFIKNGKKGSVYFIPCLNPDGVEKVLTEDPLYKANARGVDLNVNFDADWGKGEKNVFSRGAENFVGDFAFSESESSALRDFTCLIKPHGTISYHSKGEEIYYHFKQKGQYLLRDKLIAEKISKVTGYAIKETPNSCGGYKDWCILNLKIPSLTIEVGKDELSHPIEKRHAKNIFEKNKGVIHAFTESL